MLRRFKLIELHTARGSSSYILLSVLQVLLLSSVRASVLRLLQVKELIIR